MLCQGPRRSPDTHHISETTSYAIAICANKDSDRTNPGCLSDGREWFGLDLHEARTERGNYRFLRTLLNDEALYLRCSSLPAFVLTLRSGMWHLYQSCPKHKFPKNWSANTPIRTPSNVIIGSINQSLKPLGIVLGARLLTSSTLALFTNQELKIIIEK